MAEVLYREGQYEYIRINGRNHLRKRLIDGLLEYNGIHYGQVWEIMDKGRMITATVVCISRSKVVCGKACERRVYLRAVGARGRAFNRSLSSLEKEFQCRKVRDAAATAL